MDKRSDDSTLDAPWYEATYPDVALSGLSPAEHYLIIGRHLGRPTRPRAPQSRLAEVVAAVVAPASETPVSAHPGPDVFPIVEVVPDSPAGIPQLSREQANGPTGLRSGLAGSIRNAEALLSLGPRLSLFAELHGRTPQELFGLSEPLPSASPDEVVDPELRRGPRRILDLWLAPAATLCLRLDGPEGGQEGVSLQVHQADPSIGGALRRVGGQRLASKGQSFVEAHLRNPLMPVLLELVGEDGATLDLAVLAFPSLVRGGLHAAEVIGLIDGQSTTETLWAYSEGRVAELCRPQRAERLSRVLVSLEGAGGGEPVFSRMVAEWLALFGLAAEPMPGTPPREWERLGAAPPVGGSGDRRGPILALPCDALPTIAALTEPRLSDPGAGRRSVVPYLVADAVTGRPRWAVTPPSEQVESGLGEVPSLIGAEEPDLSLPAILPLAVRYREPKRMEPLRLLLPSMPEGNAPAASHGSPDVVCVLDVSEAASARVALMALARQQGIEGTRLALQGDEAAVTALGRDVGLFPGPVERLGRDAGPSDLLALAGGAEALFLLEDRIVLHDPRTLARLRNLLAQERTASAACVTLHESARPGGVVVETESGGYFPSRVGFVGGPHLLFERPDTVQALPNATYPVVANALSATVVARRALEEVASLLPPDRPLDDLTFGLEALGLGWRHLCTSEVRAGSLRPRASEARIDPVALRRVAPARWEDLLARVTLLRELR